MNYGITVVWKGNDKSVLHGPNVPLRTQIQFFNDAVRKRNLIGVDRIQIVSSGTGILRDKRFHAQRHKGVKAHNAVNPEGDAGCPPDPAGEPDTSETKVETSGETEQQESAKAETEESAKVEIGGEENAVETPSVETSSKAPAETTATPPPADEPAKAATGRKRGSSQS